MNFKYIQKTPLYKTFSDIGKRIFLPEGIFYWARRAKNEAELIGTIGSAYGFEKDFIDGGSSDWMPCYLKEISEKVILFGSCANGEDTSCSKYAR